MTHIMKQSNIGLIAASALLASAVIVTGANAIDSGIESQDRVHLKHKLWLEENAVTDHDNDQDRYESSQQAKTAAHANSVIAKAYGRQS